MRWFRTSEGAPKSAATTNQSEGGLPGTGTPKRPSGLSPYLNGRIAERRAAQQPLTDFEPGMPAAEGQDNSFHDFDLPEAGADSSEGLGGDEEDVPAARPTEQAAELAAAGESELAKIAPEAKKFLDQNMAAIVEGVLNTTDDINQRDNYIEGSNLELRRQLGEKLKELQDPALENQVKNLMKQEMAAYLKQNEKALAEAAIKNAPTLASVFEVVKRYKEIKDGEKAFGRDDLLAARENALALDGRLEVYLNLGGDQGAISEGDARAIKGLIQALAGQLPLALGIRAEVLGRLEQKMRQVEELRTAPSAGDAGNVSAGGQAENIAAVSPAEKAQAQKSGFFSKVKAGLKGWWGRK